MRMRFCIISAVVTLSDKEAGGRWDLILKPRPLEKFQRRDLCGQGGPKEGNFVDTL